MSTFPYGRVAMKLSESAWSAGVCCDCSTLNSVATEISLTSDDESNNRFAATNAALFSLLRNQLSSISVENTSGACPSTIAARIVRSDEVERLRESFLDHYARKLSEDTVAVSLADAEAHLRAINGHVVIRGGDNFRRALDRGRGVLAGCVCA